MLKYSLTFVAILVSHMSAFSTTNECKSIFSPTTIKPFGEEKSKALIENYILKLHMYPTIEISNKEHSDIIFRQLVPGNPLFFKAFQLLPYIRSQNPEQHKKEVIRILKDVFYSNNLYVTTKVISIISNKFHTWSAYLSLEVVKDIIEDSPEWKNESDFLNFNDFLRVIEIYENAIKNFTYEHSLMYDLSHKREDVLSRNDHFFHIQKFATISSLNILVYLPFDSKQAYQMYNDFIEYDRDLPELNSKNNGKIFQILEDEFLKLEKSSNYVLSDKKKANHVLSEMNLVNNGGKGVFKPEIFSLLPYINVEDPFNLYSFRIKRAIKSVLLSLDVEVLKPALHIIFSDFEKYSPYISQSDIGYLIESPIWMDETMNPLFKRELKEIMAVMRIISNDIRNLGTKNFIYLENIVIDELSGTIESAQTLYLKRLAVFASLNIYTHLFENYPTIYENPHPYFYDNLKTVLDDIVEFWDKDSYLCQLMLEIIRKNDSLFKIEPNQLDLKASNIQSTIEEIKNNLVEVDTIL